MELLVNRYRNVTILAIALAAQLFLLAYQVKSRQEVRSIRVWAVTGVMPLARLLDVLHANTFGLISEYASLVKAREETRKLQDRVSKLQMENQFLRNDLSTADRARVLALFQARTPSKTVAAHVTGRGPDNSKVVFVDRGANDGVKKNMPVVTSDGIVGRVGAAYPSFSQVVLLIDTNFKAGVISQKHRIPGTLKGQGHSTCLVDYIQNQEKLEVGDWFFTSGDDLIFPKGMPVGQVKSTREGKMFFQEVHLVPSGLQKGLEEVLIVLDGVHQPLPDSQTVQAQQPHLMQPPPAEQNTSSGASRVIRGGVVETDADQVVDRYRRIGIVQGHPYGAGGVPNFNIEPPPPAPKPDPESRPAEPRGQQPE